MVSGGDERALSLEEDEEEEEEPTAGDQGEYEGGEEAEEECDEDEVVRAQVEAAELKQRLQSEVSVKYGSHVTFTRVFLNDKDIMKGFKVSHFVHQLINELIAKAVDKCEEGDDLIAISVRENASALKHSMEEMGLGEGEMLPLSFGGGAKGGGGTKKVESAEDGSRTCVRQAAGSAVVAVESHLGLAVGDICDCYFDEDGRWYPARIEWMGPDKAKVIYLGYNEPKLVPHAWLTEASDETRKYVAEVVASGGAGQQRAAKQQQQKCARGGSSEGRNKHVRFGSEEGEEEEEEGGGDGRTQQLQKEEEEEEEEEGAAMDPPPPPEILAVMNRHAERAAERVAGRKRRRSGGGGGHHSSSTIAGKEGRRKPPPDVPAKYWSQRFRLFSQFDRGCRLDDEGWYSVTPERISQHIAERSRCDVVVDCFVGCGGNAIQFAMTCHHVIAIDIDPVKLECARHNARIYGVEDRIEFILGDAISILPSFKGKVDLIFLSPPWGGPQYLSDAVYDMRTIRCPIDGMELLCLALSVTPNVAALLPRNVDVRQLAEVATEGSTTIPCEIEENLLNYKVKTTTVYYGGEFFPPMRLEQKKKKRRNKQKKHKVESHS